MTSAAQRLQPRQQSSSKQPWNSPTRPELDHHVPCKGPSTVIDVLDSRDNRAKRGVDGSNDGHLSSECGKRAATRWPAGAASRRERPRGKAAKKGTAARQLDQFYTRDEVVLRCIRRLSKCYDLSASLLIEPSAGDGAFVKRLPINTVAFDAAPKRRGIWKADYLALELRCGYHTITVGNPPFGTNASLAVAFFNHAARHSDVIAMILPRSFLKASIENGLAPAFHLINSERVPPDAFELDGECCDVGAVFQIWERKAVLRTLRTEETSHPDFEFSTPADFDFTIRRNGANAGDIGHARNVHEKSHYFIKGNVEHIMRQLDLVGAAGKATSTPSLAKSELVALYRAFIERGDALAAKGPRSAPPMASHVHGQIRERTDTLRP